MGGKGFSRQVPPQKHRTNDFKSHSELTKRSKKPDRAYEIFAVRHDDGHVEQIAVEQTLNSPQYLNFAACQVASARWDIAASSLDARYVKTVYVAKGGRL